MTRRGLRLHIGIFGRRNSGKSSLLNAITRQNVSIVSEVAGTTTDPVEKPMELLPLGPVLFIDTAGVDDVGALGAQRVEKTRMVFDRTDLGIVVADAREWGSFEAAIIEELQARNISFIIVLNKCDCSPVPEGLRLALAAAGRRVVETIATQGQGIGLLRQALLDTVPEDFLSDPDMLSDLVPPGECAVLVVPIDKEAPRGRLIVPQAQAIRNLLDHDALCMVVKDSELSAALAMMKRPPRIVVTDSQAFEAVAAITPREVPLTGFSILLSRMQGDLVEQVAGAMALDTLVPGDPVLIAESCSHHPIEDDIGRVKIPRWLSKHVGGDLRIEHVQGHDFPRDLERYKLVVHCGACMTNRREVLSRILHCKNAGVPISNYGLVIAYSLGLFERALEPFPAALEEYRQRKLDA